MSNYNIKKEGKADTIDMIVAQRLLRRRCLLGYSQKDLADCTGISIQQVQKYEKSVNRISSGRLYRFAKFLKVPINYFFDNIEDLVEKKTRSSYSFAEDQATFEANNDEYSTEKEIINLVKAYNGIQDQNVKKKLLELMKAISVTADSV